MKAIFAACLLALLVISCNTEKESPRTVEKFNDGWQFILGDSPEFKDPAFDDGAWRTLQLPHDWSIEGAFDENNPASPNGGALPGGIGWYRKSFALPEEGKGKKYFIDFDGVYCNSEVWINGQSLGFRPNGYISFRYELTPHLKFGSEENVIAVRVDNSRQPNSRWYSGSGIYRNVWLVSTGELFVEHWGTFVTTPKVGEDSAVVTVKTKVTNASGLDRKVDLTTIIQDPGRREAARQSADAVIPRNSTIEFVQEFTLEKPALWSVDDPRLYKAISKLEEGKDLADHYETTFGIRDFYFDIQRGFFLNGKPLKILGVCNHHDLGCLGAAVNKRAIERQLEIMKGMGVNAIRTSHNPPAPELLDLCDRMGLLVMDEAFDVWKIPKVKYGYFEVFDEWWRRDLEDMVLRDRNHPSVILWSIGNEIMEQWDSTGLTMTPELAKVVKALDNTRPVIAGCNPPNREWNFMVRSGALEIIGYNYDLANWKAFPENFPGQAFLATETTSALATRGQYDMPSDTIYRWPIRWDVRFTGGNPDQSISAYDQVSTPWGSTHMESWRLIKKHDYLSGMFIWTGFDYLGEPTPYWWPARSSYFGIVDLAGFPKDAYFMYQSEWTKEPVLHVFPHWNWPEGKVVDVWAYTNCGEVELFLNGKSLGTKAKSGDDLHLLWRVACEPGVLKAVGRTNGEEILTKEIHTAGPPAKIVLQPDRKTIRADGEDLSFVTVRVEDADGNLVPDASNLVNFEISGAGFIAGVDNGSQTSHEPFKASYRKAFNGLCLAVVQSNGEEGKITLKATSEGLEDAEITLDSK